MPLEFFEPDRIGIGDIEDMEAVLGFNVNNQVREFLLKYSDSLVSENSFDVGELRGHDSLHQVLNLKDVAEDIEYIYQIESLSYPIISCVCGNYVIVNEGLGGALFHWDHEFSKFTRLSHDLVSFLRSF